MSGNATPSGGVLMTVDWKGDGCNAVLTLQAPTATQAGPLLTRCIRGHWPPPSIMASGPLMVVGEQRDVTWLDGYLERAASVIAPIPDALSPCGRVTWTIELGAATLFHAELRADAWPGRDWPGVLRALLDDGPRAALRAAREVARY